MTASNDRDEVAVPSRARTASERRDGSDAPRLFLITGHPRSGTTLLAEILCRHAALDVLPETHFFDNAVALRRLRTQLARGELRGGIEVCAQHNPSFAVLLAEGGGLDAFVDHCRAEGAQSAPAVFLAFLNWLRAQKGVRSIGEKTPNHIFEAIALGALDPNLRVIDIVRDPRDITLSWRKVPWGESDASFVALRWRRAVAVARRVAAALGPRFLQIRYEDLVQAPDVTIERLCSFLGVVEVPAMRRGAVASKTYDPSAEPWKAKAREAISTGSVERWRRELHREEVRAVEMIAAADLRQLGYAECFGTTPWLTRVASHAHGVIRALSVAASRKLPWGVAPRATTPDRNRGLRN